ncbi:coagulation factor VIII-like isoform X2 [Chlorella sorokiniana]|uniref:Coagulation factor VIII-like isoform X2 n=1 Tax=Chlorella sorokiniana TaxID=3076 RepID=A0A2P6TJW5_CHLSO|nr:coagulation factor VIII-like isoform X2 [Chlorella sorokiniana]|eukprot:PRW44376.1 coagulation factor VIII-like isoform X2 [Chlorella sorokiniana]
MRALQAFQRVASSLGAVQTTGVTAAILGAGSCRLRGLATSALAREQGKPEAVFPDALDQEFDRGEDPAMAAAHEREYEEQQKARQEMGTVCADLEYELDRDDPDAVDPNASLEVWAEAKAAECPEVDLDTEFDRDDPMMADRSHLWDAPEPPQPADVSGEMDLMADVGDVPAEKQQKMGA